MAKANPIRLGIVGLGRAGWGMQYQELRGREKRFRVVAGCDPIRKLRDRLGAACGCRTYARTEELLADRDVELVSVATRSCDHFAHAKLALQAGKHVFLEKPMTVTYAEARQLKSLAARKKRKLFVRHNCRYEPAFTHIREIIASGVLGEVYEVNLRRCGYARRDDWQTLKRYGGGQLLNWGPHIIDHALRFLESPVRSLWGDLKRIAAVGDAEDHLKIVLRGRNGRVVDLEISGGAALSEPEYLVLATRGALSADTRTITLRYLDPRRKLPPRRANPGAPGETFGEPEKLSWIEKTIPVAPAEKIDMTMIWDDLYDAIRKRKRFRVSLDESIEVMKIISAVRKGTPFDQGRTV